MQQDPASGELANPVSVVNRYSYVGNSPVMAVDPSGLIAVQIGGALSVFFPIPSPLFGAGGGVESGIAISYSRNYGFQVAGYQSAQIRGGAGVYGGGSLNFTITPDAQKVSDLSGHSYGGGVDIPAE